MFATTLRAVPRFITKSFSSLYGAGKKSVRLNSKLERRYISLVRKYRLTRQTLESPASPAVCTSEPSVYGNALEDVWPDVSPIEEAAGLCTRRVRVTNPYHERAHYPSLMAL